MFTMISRAQYSFLITWLVVFAAFALIGFRDFLTNLEPNRCDMTWMYEWPQYIKVPLWKGTSKKFPVYGLYLYGEGSYAEESKELRLHGIPVLFIPGNTGSHRQVRSLASVALRKAERSRFHFNYFTVDLDESLSGVFGGVLREQTEFVRLCVARILWLYREASNPPTSVILVGHSMGGLIARGLFMLPKFKPSQVHTIITLGTPHQHPVVSLDPQLAEYYDNVNNLWRTAAPGSQSSPRLQNVTLVSVSGGHRDLLVRSSLSSLRQLAPGMQSISVVATSVPTVWVSIDHLCLCWCKQLVLVINRALFALIDPVTWQICEDKQLRHRVFEHYFVKNPGTKRVALNNQYSLPSKEMVLGLVPVVLHRRLWRFKKGASTTLEDKLFVFPLAEWSTNHDFLIILTSLDTEQWLFRCQDTACSNMTGLSHDAEILMSNRGVMKFVQLRFKDFPGTSFFAVYVPKSKTVDVLWSEYQSSVSSTHEIEMPGLLSRKSFLSIASDSLFANITLRSVDKAWKVYTFYIAATDCNISKSKIVGRLHVPWFNEDVYEYSSNGLLNLVLKLHHAKPRRNQQQVQIHLWWDPRCSLKVSVQHDAYQMLGQIYRLYAVQLPYWTFCIVLLVFAWQLFSMSNDQHCDSFFALIANTARSARVLLLIIQSHFFISQLVLAYLVLGGEPGHHDWLPNIDDLKTFIWLLPLTVIVSTAVIIVVAMFVWIGMFVRLSSLLLGRFKFSFQTQTRLGSSDCFLALAIVVISLLFCGTLSLIVTFLLLLYRSGKYAAMFREYQRQPVEQRDKRLLTLLGSVGNLTLTLSMLLFLVIIINLPALAVWASKTKNSYHLPSDHTTLLSIVIGLNVIGFDFLIKVPRSVVYFCFISGVAVTQAPVIPLHIAPYVICLLLSVLNATQVLSKVKRARDKED